MVCQTFHPIWRCSKRRKPTPRYRILSTYKHLQWQYQYYKYPPVLGQWPGRSYSTGNAPLFLWQPRLQQQSISLAHEIPTSPTMHEIPRYLRPQDVLQEWGATRHENIDIPPKELVALDWKKKNKHLHRTSCGWSPTSASWCMTSRGLSESTTSRKPGVRIGLRLPTLRRTSTEKLSTRQRPYFNPPKCPANKSLNILSIGLGFFQTISSFPGVLFFKLGSWWGDWTIVSISCIDNCLSLSSKSREPCKIRLQLVGDPDLCRFHLSTKLLLDQINAEFIVSEWLFIYRYIYIYIYTRSLFSPSTQINDCWLFLVASSPLSQSDCYDWFLLKMIAPQQWSVSNYW